jgi:hypothetical protein
MSDKPIPPIPPGILTQEQIDAVAGGGCTIESVVKISDQLKEAYDNLIDFTVYVAERVAGKQ